MSVPSSFTSSEVVRARDFIIEHVRAQSWFAAGKVHGNPYLAYSDLVGHLGYSIECESDGDRCGIVSGMVSEMEFKMGHPLLSAVVVDKNETRPGKGFFSLAQTLGLLPKGSINLDGSAELVFWNSQVADIVRLYGRSKSSNPRTGI